MEDNEVTIQLERYKDLILERDQLSKDKVDIYYRYVKRFGQLIEDEFKLKMECIKLKKLIAYCQLCENRGEEITAEAVEQQERIALAPYLEELKILQGMRSDPGRTVSEYEVAKAKKIYHRIAKKIHPDLNPGLAGDSRISELWERAVVAYDLSNMKDLEEIEVLVDSYLTENGIEQQPVIIVNIEAKIKALEEEINKIITTDPYMFRWLLEDEDLCAEKEKELSDSIAAFKKYRDGLQEVLDKFDIR